MRSANNDMQNTIRIATSLLYSSRLYFALPLPLPYFYSTSASKSTPAPTPLLYSTLLCSTLLYSTSIYSTSTLPLLDSTSTLLFSTLPSLYLSSTSTLPLLYFTQGPTGHNDLWASENVTYIMIS